MQRTPLAISALILFGGLAACSGPSGMTPTAPSASPQTAQPGPTPGLRGPGSGTISVRDVSPAPSATLTVTDCPGTPTMQRCAEQWRSTIDVLVDQDMTNAVLVMGFYDGDRLCGLSAATTDVVRAGVLETFTLSSISLSSGAPVLATDPCPLPARTTRLTVALWSDSSSWTNSLAVELPGTYTFVGR